MGWLDITLTGNDKTYLGAAAGAVVGAGLIAATGGAATPIVMAGLAGTAAGASLGGIKAQEDLAIRASNTAQELAEKSRITSVLSQHGARQQAETLAFGGLTRNKASSKSSQQPGFIGQNLPTSAGTF